jgi:hypothetical protein
VTRVETPAVATRPSRPWITFLAGGAAGFAILLLTQILSETRIEFGPWALNGNGALAVPLLGFPLAIYAGWTALADRHAGRELAIQIAAFSVGLTLGSVPLGLFFGLPILIITAAVYMTWTRRSRVESRDPLLWIAFAGSLAIGMLPILGLFGVALLPASAILLARGKPLGRRIALGALVVGAAFLIVFIAPLLFPAPAPSA